MTAAPNDRFRISHPCGSVTVVHDGGHLIGWTELGELGWSAFWHGRSGGERRWADSPEAAAELLFAGIASEEQS